MPHHGRRLRFFRQRRARLIDHCRAEAELEKPPKDGTGRIRDHLMSVWRQTGRKPKALQTPECPEELAYLWSHYCSIKRGQPLTWSELAAWSQMTGIRLRGWESETLMQIESAVQKAMTHDNDG